MLAKSRYPLLLILSLSVAIVCLLLAGLLDRRQQYLTRGIPDELPQPIFHAGVRFGINADLTQYEEPDLQSQITSMYSAGIVAVKQPFYYSEQYDWQTSDLLINHFEKGELKLIPLLDGNPEQDFAPPADISDYANWAAEFANRYGEVIDYYIIWDEPNLTTHWGLQQVNPAAYGALLVSASSAIRQVDPVAYIVAAPLAPTVETGPDNLSDVLFLQSLYREGIQDSIDVVAAKPYGFDTGPYDREVDASKLNFSRVILLREVMKEFGDEDKAMWAGNWGWNALPADWQGLPSIWGQVNQETKYMWIGDALSRARQEWPWMGMMFLENWRIADAADPRSGFSIADDLPGLSLPLFDSDPAVAYPGFDPAYQFAETQDYEGSWRFGSGYGGDVGKSGDRITFRFWGTDVGMRVRRADFHARFYATVDGNAANALPYDGTGAALVLNSADPGEDKLSMELIADGLEPSEHVLEVTALRGSDQWALNGFSVLYRPDTGFAAMTWILYAISLAAALAAGLVTTKISWGRSGKKLNDLYSKFDQKKQLALTAAAAGLLVAMGWLTWGEHAAGIYRRSGDGAQIAMTAITASALYITPWFFGYLAAAIIYFALVFLRPAWGAAIIAFTIPFYVKPKPLLGYRFSPVEIFIVLSVGAVALRFLFERLLKLEASKRFIKVGLQFRAVDWAVLSLLVAATVSLPFTERIGVATNEWRTVIVEPVAIYVLLRTIVLRDREVSVLIDAFIAGGLLVALVGLLQYATGQNLITSEAGLMRLRSIYGSPNNVALYLGRVIPLLLAVALTGSGSRRRLSAIALVPVGLAMILTFSKGAFFAGLPVSLLVIIYLWRRQKGGAVWPWIVVPVGLGVLLLFAAFQIQGLSERLDPSSTTGLLRLNLWQSSLYMFRDHWLTGVGLDNFLYAYRGRYILDSAWLEPNLNHPHNIVLDFATRLGIPGLISGAFLFVTTWRISRRNLFKAVGEWQSLSIGLAGAFFYMLAHGMVDHSLFLVDLAFSFFLLLAVAVWLATDVQAPLHPDEPPNDVP